MRFFYAIFNLQKRGDTVESKMNERLKKVRKAVDMTQDKFGQVLGLKQNTIAGYEMGIREPSNAVITLICKEFTINEVWLRTGEGGDDNMFTAVSDDDRFSLNLGKLSMTENEFVKNGVNLLAETEPEKLKILEEFMKAWLGIK